ncbi:hypothetical protein M0R45_009257 [Rubus argutus]|uniref:Uncharacterized protein n=1 Tax=Rubus argutus TaxID=59490 RepID=A0AAW1Y4G6_RUBAR
MPCFKLSSVRQASFTVTQFQNPFIHQSQLHHREAQSSKQPAPAINLCRRWRPPAQQAVPPCRRPLFQTSPQDPAGFHMPTSITDHHQSPCSLTGAASAVLPRNSSPFLSRRCILEREKEKKRDAGEKKN